MPHDKHVIDGINKDLCGDFKSRDQYLELTKDFKSQMPQLVVEQVEGVRVVREDKLGVGGTKARAGEFLFSRLESDTVVYCVPRVGHAGVAVTRLGKLYGKRVVLFMPASKEISDHQAATIAAGADEVVFHRIAAMPNLNRLAKMYADDHKATYLPFGLNHPYVIAGFVRACEDLRERGFSPAEMWVAVSTGVLCRGLQIGFPEMKINGVAVARNMKAGEIGRANLISEPLGFIDRELEGNRPPFDSVATYDAKVWKYIPKNSGSDVWFWNVAGEIHKPLDFDKSSVNSQRGWGE